MPLFIHEHHLHHFAHVPKCGGTTIEEALKKRFGDLAFFDSLQFSLPSEQRWTRTSPQHATAKALTRIIPNTMLGESFGIVRHPLARVVSAYQHVQRRGRLPPSISPEAWLDQVFSVREQRPWIFDNHLCPACDFTFDHTVVFRLEDGMTPVAKWFANRFGGTLEITNRQENIHARTENDREEPVSQALREKVVQYYSEDFERFSYDPDGLPDLTVTRITKPQKKPFRNTIRTAVYKTSLAKVRLGARLPNFGWSAKFDN